jgi:ribosomal protein S18 acetylase RimI-like enzyme
MEAGLANKAYEIKPLLPEYLTDVYLAFQDAFTDYPMPVALSLNQFHYKFVVRLGLNYELSTGLWLRDKLIAFILATQDSYDGKNIIYHGCLGVRRRYRGNRFISTMYEAQRQVYAVRGIDMCLLEVLTSNDRARSIYEYLGYRIHRRLISYQKPLGIRNLSKPPRASATIPWDVIQTWFNTTPSYANSRSVIERSRGQEMTLLLHQEEIISGVITFDIYEGRISLLIVHPEFRRRGLGTKLLAMAIHYMQCAYAACMNVPESDTAARGFLKKMGFSPLCEQFEMRLEL